MSENFWKKITKDKKPFFVLAPMDDITNWCFGKL